MNLTTQWMQSEWVKALGWTFVHSLWQIAVVGLLLFIILRLIPGRSAHIRYTISTMALWMILMMSLSTFIIMLPEAKESMAFNGQIILLSSSEQMSTTQQITAWLEARMPMMLSVWLGGVLILMLRLALSLGWIRHMRTASIPDAGLQQSLDVIIHRLRLRIRTVASTSYHVQSPVTIGHIKPLILFPVAIINQLNPREVEAILTHELAHIVRHDYLSNLIQSFIETLFYYHPVTWWISRMVRTERENRADDLAVSWCGDQLGYAKALMTVEQMQAEHSIAHLAVGFGSKKGAMLSRIQRILHLPYKNHNQMEKTVLLSLCSLCLFAFTLTSHTNAVENKKNEIITKDQTVLRSIAADTLPAEGTYRIHKKTDDKEIRVEVEDGNIKELEVDGQQISPSEYEVYDELISELFGGMQAPPAVQGYYYNIPGTTPLPSIPQVPMNELFELGVIPPMPPMPPMAPMEFEELFGDENIAVLGGNMKNFKLRFDTLNPGATRIIMIQDGDSTVILGGKMDLAFPGNGAYEFHMPDIELEHYRMDAEEWEKQSEFWKEHAEQWKQHQGEWKDQHREMYKDAERMREEALKQYRTYDLRDLQNEQQLLESLRAQELQGKVYSLRGPWMGINESLLEDGLIKPGQQAEILLTPDKMKIDGKKVDDSTHQKYLKLYEAQQGFELSGNSRVEFKTKNRRSM